MSSDPMQCPDCGQHVLVCDYPEFPWERMRDAATNGDRQEDVEDGKPLSDSRAFYVEDGA